MDLAVQQGYKPGAVKVTGLLVSPDGWPDVGTMGMGLLGVPRVDRDNG